MSRAWQLQEAKSKFSQLVDQALTEGPQLVTRRGEASVVVISVDEYKRLKAPKNDLLSFFRNAPKAELDIERTSELDRDITL